MQSMKILNGDGVLLSQPLLIEQFGRAGAQFLSQLHYWLNHNQNLGTMSNGAKWIYNSAKDWADQLCMSSRTIQRLISSLNNSGVLEIQKLSSNKHNRTNHYTINYEVLEKLINHNEKVLKTSEKLITTKCRNASRQNDAMYIQRLPNKKINKSDERELNTEQSVSQNKFKQVKYLKNIGERNRVGHQESNLNTVKQTSTQKTSNIPIKQDLNTEITEILPKTNTAQTMLKFWNEQFGLNEKMSKELAPLLVSAYNLKFLKDLEQWQSYIGQIKSSSYLNSEKFNLSIFWALKFSIIDRIRAGEFGVKKAPANNWIEQQIMSESQIESDIRSSSEPEAFKVLRKKILQAVGVGEYISWFMQANFFASEEKIVLKAPNSFVAAVWEKNYEWLLK